MGGAGIFVLFGLHHGLNWRWYKNIFRWKYPPVRIFQVSVDILAMLSMLMLMYSGIVLSRYVFAFLPIESGLALARRLHILGSYWGFLLMSLHVGLHWSMVICAVNKKIPAVFPRLHYICFGMGLLVALYEAWVFVKRDFFTYLFLQSEFVFLDFVESKIQFYLDYLSLMGMCIFISYHWGKFLRSFMPVS